MADDIHNTSDVSDPGRHDAPNEDVETKSARRELKQTYISEHDMPNPADTNSPRSGSDEDAAAPPRSAQPSPAPAKMGAARAQPYPRQVSSPKKKRAHAEFDEHKDPDADAAKSAEEGATSDDGQGNTSNPATASTRSSAAKASNGGSSAQSRSDRSEPEKKRPRDHQDDGGMSTKDAPLKILTSPTRQAQAEGRSKTLPTTSAEAFAKSGFAKLAGSSSPFGALGGTGKPSPFGAAGTAGASPFASASTPSGGFGSGSGTPSAAPKLSFGSASGASPFATLNGGAASGSGGSALKPAFGSAFGGGGFGSAGGLGGTSLSGPRITNFGKPGESLKSDKPDKPFGAPDSEGDSDSDGEGDDGENDDNTSTRSGEEEGSRERDKEGRREEAKGGGEEKKKLKLQKVKVDDGEGDEVTLLSVRAKMFHMEKGVGWKERGVGMLKINVPKSSVGLDKRDNPDPSTFDASCLRDADSQSTESAEKSDGDKDASASGDGARKTVRLLMRQDQTHRLILNTTLMPAMKFQLTQRLKSALVLFTAFEDGSVSQVQMKLTEANATSFMQVVSMVQKQLAEA